MTTVEELRDKIVGMAIETSAIKEVSNYVDLLIAAAKEEGKEEFLSLFRYAVGEKMKSSVSATPEEIARLKQEIESHKDDSALEA